MRHPTTATPRAGRRVELAVLIAKVEATSADAHSVELVGDSHEWLLRPLSWLAADIGCLIGVEECEEGCDAHMDAVGRFITLRDGLAVNMRVKVLVHELAHALLAFVFPLAEVSELTRYEEEIVAETSAHFVCAAYGLDSSSSSIPYLAAHASVAGLDVISREAGLIEELATRMVAAIDANRREYHKSRA